MLKDIGEECKDMVTSKRIVGDEKCLDCLFHNDTYREPKDKIMCVFPQRKVKKE